jgi:AraC-like DNA-binding protein
MVLRINVDPLLQKLAALIGATPGRALEFAAATPVGEAAMRLQRLLRFFASELDVSGAKMPAPVLAETEQALMVAFLFGNPNNYSSLLEGPLRAPASWQVRRAEDYIEANWDRPLSIEALARETSTSARSLFHHFKRSRGHSPMDFLKEVRLRHAREMLQRDGSSVTETAFACRFSNLGHFARDYYRRFGERPSETLRRRPS